MDGNITAGGAMACRAKVAGDVQDWKQLQMHTHCQDTMRASAVTYSEQAALLVLLQPSAYQAVMGLLTGHRSVVGRGGLEAGNLDKAGCIP